MKTYISAKYILSFLLLVGLLAPVPASLASQAQATIPTFFIQSVVKDNTVTIITYNFPANDTYNVRMGYMGTRGVNGILVGTQNSGVGGTFTATYTIPAALHGQYQIAIRLESPTSGYYAFNWFYNNTAGTNATPGPTNTPGPSPTPGPTNTPFVIPTFTIVSVVRDSTVTIRTANFPANDSFNVRMGYMGTKGINGILVGTQASGAGGTFEATYAIPAALHGQYQIAIRLESPTSGYYAFNWFYNNTAGTGGNPGPTNTPGPSPTPGPTNTPFVIPTFNIQSVVRNNTVTIVTSNFPANDNFTVTMGYMGTKGINGIVVGTQNSGAGGTFTATYTIPAALHGQYQIAIRLQSPTSGYYAYNWFYNNTTP